MKNNSSFKKNRGVLGRWIFKIILFTGAGCMALSYASVYINPTKSFIPVFFGLYFIPIVLFNFLLLIIALLLKSRSAWIPIIVLLSSILYAERFYKIRLASQAMQEGHKLKIQTYNVGLFNSAKESLPYLTTKQLIENQIKEHHPDIVCLQEVCFSRKEEASDFIPEYKYRTYHIYPLRNGHYFGNIILSKYKILNGGAITFKRSTNLSIYSDIVFYNDTVRVYNNHLESYAISLTALIKKISAEKNDSEMLTNEIVTVHSKVRNTIMRRTRQVSKIYSHIQQSHYPTIICGDFNDTPMSYAYHKFNQRHKDTFQESGNGFAATYSYAWPLLRIDYIFIPDRFEAISHSTPKAELSDHYPVVAEFLILNTQN